MRKANLTGSSTVRPLTHSMSVSTALAQLRSSVTLCSWSVIVSLALLALIWCAAAFTSLRWDSGAIPSKDGGSVPLVVQGAGPQDEVRSAFDPVPPPPEAAAVVAASAPAKSPLDSMFASAATIANAIAVIGTLALLPLMGLGVLLAAASATDGVEKSVSGFSWTMIVVVIVLSFSGVLSMPWATDGVWSYEVLTAKVDAVAGTAGTVSPTSAVGVTVLARYMGLSLACIVGLLIALARFRAGVLAGLTPPEDLRLDAMLESEAANIKPSSLHGGRAAAAMQSAMGQDDDGPAQNGQATPPPPPALSDGPTIRAVSQGMPPQRII